MIYLKAVLDNLDNFNPRKTMFRPMERMLLDYVPLGT